MLIILFYLSLQRALLVKLEGGLGGLSYLNCCICQRPEELREPVYVGPFFFFVAKIQPLAFRFIFVDLVRIIVLLLMLTFAMIVLRSSLYLDPFPTIHTRGKTSLYHPSFL